MTKTTNDIAKLAPFDKYEGVRRTEVKAIGRTIEYRGFRIRLNKYIPNGGHGRWEIPELKYIAPGGVKEGYLTVSITQAKEAVDKWFMLNEELNAVDKELEFLENIKINIMASERINDNEKSLIDFIIKNVSDVTKVNKMTYILERIEHKIFISKIDEGFFDICVYKKEWKVLMSFFYYTSDYKFVDFNIALNSMKSHSEELDEFINLIKE